MVEGGAASIERIDELLATYTQGWTLDRMPAVDRAILRIAVYELLYVDDVPDHVVIDEAVELAKQLSTDESPAFVNGLLARIVRSPDFESGASDQFRHGGMDDPVRLSPILGPADTLTGMSSEPRRVVIAEDEALIRLDLKEMLEEEGYVVVGEAGDGEEAVQLAEELRPDLVVLDVKMPVLDGISAAERIAAARLAPVVMLTAFSQRELVERARDAGAMAYLVKPFTKADLVPAIEIAASRHARLAALEAEVADLAERLETRKLVDRAKALRRAPMG